MHTHTKVIVGLAALGVIIGLGGAANNGNIALLSGFLIVGPFLIWIYWSIWKVQRRAVDQAMTRVPEPAQIMAQLRAEGYNPSISDVMAVHSYLTRQRNAGALMAGGILLGSIYAAHRAGGF